MSPMGSDKTTLAVSESPSWRFVTDELSEGNSRLWSISADIREGFGETVVESWGSTEGAFSHKDMVAEFEHACASMPNWRPTVSHSWTQEAATYTLISGLAAIGDIEIESTSVIAVNTTDLTLAAHQAVVTTFADNRDRHVDALRHIRSTSSTIAEWWYA